MTRHGKAMMMDGIIHPALSRWVVRGGPDVNAYRSAPRTTTRIIVCHFSRNSGIVQGDLIAQGQADMDTEIWRWPSALEEGAIGADLAARR